MKIFIYTLKRFENSVLATATKGIFATLSAVLLFSMMSFNSIGQSGTFSWFDGTNGQTWASTDVSKSYTISCGPGCSVVVTMTIIDPNNRNGDPNTYTTHPFDTGMGCLPYPGVNGQADNVTGDGNFLDPWDSDCNGVLTQTSGLYGLNFLTFVMNSATHLENVTIRYTFSKPVFLDAFTVGDIDGRTLQQDRTQNQTGSPSPLSIFELPGNSFQDEVTINAIGPKGVVGVSYSALGSQVIQTGQTVRAVYDNTTTDLTPDDARGTITVTTNDAITQLDIVYSNGPDDGAAEQANPGFYSWWSNGGTYTLADGRSVTQPAQGATNGVSDNQAIRISGFTFTACPDFTFTRTNATVCQGQNATIGVVPSNGVSPYTYSWTGPNSFTSTSQNPTLSNVTASQSGIYTVVAMDANGCTGTTTAQLTVNPLPTASISGTNNLNCTTTSVTRTASGGGTYSWSDNLGTSATVTINAVGTYTVTVTNPTTGCSATATTSVIYSGLSSITAQPSLCNPSTNTYSLSGSISFSNPPTSGTLTVSVGSQSIVLNAPFSSPLSYTIPNLISDGTNKTVTADFSANSCPVSRVYTAPVSCACPTQNNRLCAGESYTLTAQAGMTGYQWFRIVGTDTTAISGATNQIYTATTVGKYIWKAKDANGCDIKLCCPVEIIQGICYGSIGDYVWSDANNDGQQAGESPIAGVRVILYAGDGVTKLDSTVTDATGKYLFDSLLTGSYKVRFVAPVGTIAAKSNVGSDVSDSDAGSNGFSHLINIDTSKLPTDSLRNNTQIDGGFVPVGSIGDDVFSDLNGNGLQDVGEPLIDGIKVYLLNSAGVKIDSTVTANGGKYLFDSLLSNTYSVQFVIPPGSEATLKSTNNTLSNDSDINPDGKTNPITINTSLPLGDIGRNNLTIGAGLQSAYGSIGDYVWSDANNDGQQAGESPIAGVKVILYAADGVTKLDSTVTDATGKYLFDSLLTGSYKVRFVAPVGTIAAKSNVGSDVSDSDAGNNGFSHVINIDTSKLPTDSLRNNTQVGGGFVPVGSIGDDVFSDLNGNGLQDVGEPLIDGIKVYLLNSAGVKIDSTVTANGGKYLFDSLLSNTYSVQFVIPVGSEATLKSTNNTLSNDSDINPDGKTNPITINTTLPLGDIGRNNNTIGAGLNLAYGSIGDYVWSDANNDGQQAGESPIAGVKVILYAADGVTKLDSTVTDATGKYLFDSLLTGSYKVRFIAPAGTIAAKSNVGSDTSDSDAGSNGFSHLINIDTSKLPTDSLRNNTQVDGGFVPVGSIGDDVFSDLNGNGLQDVGEPLIDGIKVYLLNSAGVKIDSTVTANGGKYLFDSLLSNTYSVQFVIPSGSEATLKSTNNTLSNDSDINPDGKTNPITINTALPLGDIGRNNNTIGAGLQSAYGSIGDYVWSDANNDGQQAGESPIAGVRVILYAADGVTKLDSTATDATGKYLFDSLLTGSYKVRFIAPAGTIAAKSNVGSDVSDSDAGSNGFSHVINIDTSKLPTDSLRNNTQIGGGFVPVGSIGDDVFSDLNGNGLQDVGEPLIDGIKVYLLNSAGVKIDSTVTTNGGKYLFDSLLSGTYFVQFVTPPGSEATTISPSTNSSNDSDINPDGRTNPITIDATLPVGNIGRGNGTIGAGFRIPYGSIGDYVWTDINRDGKQGDPLIEKPIQGVKVYLYDAAGTTILDSTTTDSDGKYLFGTLTTGSYKVKFELPVTASGFTKSNSGDDTKDSDVQATGFTQVININTALLSTDTLRNNLNIDAGVICQPTITVTPKIQTVCAEGTVSPFSRVIVSGNVSSQQWYGPLTDTTSSLGTEIAGEVNATFTPSTLPSAGQTRYYAVVARNGDALCADTAFVILTVTPKISLTATSNNVLCKGGQGSITTTVSGGISPYTYIWSTGATTSSINNLSAGSYTVTVTDVNGCKADTTLALTEPDSLDLSVIVSNVSCNGNSNGALISTLTGGKTPYTYEWYNGNTTSGLYFSNNPSVTGLSAGTYTLKVIDANGCFKSKTIEVIQPIAFNVAQTQKNNICFDESKGEISVSIGGGTAPVGIQWKVNGVINPAYDGLSVITGLKAGIYELILTDANQCVITVKDTLTQPDSLVINITKEDGLCATGNKGSINSMVSGGFAPYSYKWSNGESTANITDLVSGNYKLVITDAKGCKDSVTVFVDEQDCRVDIALKKTVEGECERKAGDIVNFKVVVARKDTTTQNTTVIVKDQIASDFTIVSSIATKGSFDVSTGQWSGIILAKGDSATLTVSARINATAKGLLCNQAYVDFLDKKDIDSQAGNLNPTEDDIAYACVSVPISICSSDGQSITLTTPDSLTNIRWYKNDVEIVSEAGKKSILVSAAGSYTYTGISNGTDCQVGNCCPVIIKDGCFGSIGDYVFRDSNLDGKQTSGELPVANIKIYLLDGSTGVILDSTLSDNNGKYLFDSLLSKTYRVQFVAPAGSTFTSPNQGGDPTVDSNVGINGISNLITIDNTRPAIDTLRNNPHVDAGIIPQYGSIGDYVWSDVNNDGQQQIGESPIAGVKVILYAADGVTKLDSTVTDATGKYLFDSLLTGSYKVRFIAPAGTIPAKSNVGSDVSDSDAGINGFSHLINIDTSKLPTDSLRNNTQVDGGFVPVGSIGDFVFNDLDNSNTQTSGDTPVSGVKVYLLNNLGVKIDCTVTDATGKYLFDSLLAGTYSVQFVKPVGFDLVTPNVGTDDKDSDANATDGKSSPIIIDTTQPLGSASRDSKDVDAGIIPQYGSIGDYVWSDVNNDGQQQTSESPIAGVKVILYAGDGITKLDSTVTDATGKYLFDSLLTGSYKVRFVAPAGTIPAKSNVGSDASDSDAGSNGFSHLINIDSSKLLTDSLRNNTQVDGGFVPVGSLGDYAFLDNDNNNVQSAGDKPMQNVKVYLLNNLGIKIDSAITDINGKYLFDSLVNGNYTVQFVKPFGFDFVKINVGAASTDSDADTLTGKTAPIFIDTTKPLGDPARNNRDADTGFKPIYGSLGDFVWFDKNNDGVQQPSELPIQGVKVYLYNAAGTVKLDSAITNVNGKYLFDSLSTGSYKVRFIAPIGTVPSKSNVGDDLFDSDANKLGWTHVVSINTSKLQSDTLRNNPNIDAGFVPVGSIGDYVWFDINKDGLQTNGEPPVKGVKVYLINATTGARLDSTITDAAGKYLFDSLVSSTYKVQFVAPKDTNFTVQGTNPSSAIDSNPIATTGLTDVITIDASFPLGNAARDNQTVDAGLTINLGSIAGKTFDDNDNSGSQNAGDTNRPSVKVYLYKEKTPNNFVLVDSVVTDSQGNYMFGNLLSGNYQVQFKKPVGSSFTTSNIGDDTKDSDANPSDGRTGFISINTNLPETDAGRNSKFNDAGFIPLPINCKEEICVPFEIKKVRK